MATNICNLCGCLYEANRNQRVGYCDSCKPKMKKLYEQNHREAQKERKRIAKFKKANRLLYDALKKLKEYNTENGTNLSYGQFIGKGYITNPPQRKSQK